jgi:hypothetical protein
MRIGWKTMRDRKKHYLLHSRRPLAGVDELGFAEIPGPGALESHVCYVGGIDWFHSRRRFGTIPGVK